MALLSVRGLTFGFTGPPLFDGAEFQIQPGERICLLGRNGEGKSTFLRLLSGDLEPDEGEIARRRGLSWAALDQRVPDHIAGTIYEVVAEGLGARGALLTRHHTLTESFDESSLAKLEQIQAEIDSADAWGLQRDVDRALSKLSLDPNAAFDSLSAGMKRRVLLARALVCEPDLLLLDEPTNHLDLDAIAWMEEFLTRYKGSLLFVTHDRTFLRNVATRIVDLDRGTLRSWDCNYNQYLKRRVQAEENEAKEQARLDKKLAAEETWIRKGIKARRTRNEGRVRALERLREERKGRRERTGRIQAELHEGQRSGQKVIEAREVTLSYDGRKVVDNFSMQIFRGDKIGLIGPNGVGKSTLLKLLLGELSPDSGSVIHGTKLDVAYFDQLHQKLDESKTVLENITDGTDFVELGERRLHVRGYLEKFLFSADRVNGRLDALSGGERNRLLLAKLFTRPANVLVLDEPTNDLDIESLEVLEDVLVGYSGTLLIVSHDRAFLDNVVTSSLIFEGHGRIREIDGGYGSWDRIRQHEVESASTAEPRVKKKTPAPPKSDKPKRLTYKEKQELETLPGTIESLEATIADWHERMADPAFFRQDSETIVQAKEALAHAEAELETTFVRWEELEGRQ